MGYQLWVSPTTGYRRKGTRFSSLKKIFVDNVTVHDVFEPLFCCQISDAPEHVKHELEVREFDQAGVVNEHKQIIGYIETKNLNGHNIENHLQKISIDQVISDSTPLADLLNVLKTKELAYVNHGNQVVGIVTKADINKPPVRVYIFGIISLFEMHINFWIRKFHAHDNWTKHLNEKRLKIAKSIYEMRKGENQDLMLLDCIQIADKRDILSRTSLFCEQFNFSRRRFDKLLKIIEKMRNELAHSQSSVIANISWNDFATTLESAEGFLMESDQMIEQLAKDHAHAFEQHAVLNTIGT
ncbi:CBS domain-containing protein [Thalassotalea litorea]|uniref:CBS domain-containing protein n=1 Tax=Thalassotalea litorea TaxID=2020715 RepID=UPI00373559EF